jgi:anti-sigma-K factor RskA
VDDRLNPDELRELLGAFALGAVDETEQEQVETFVLDDHDARVELHQLEHAVAWLGHASPRPSEASWNAVSAEMTRDLEVGSEKSNDDEDPNDRVVAMESFESRRSPNRWRRLVAVAAAAVILVGSAIAVSSAILEDSGNPAHTVALNASDGRRAAVVHVASNGTAVIQTASLPTPPAGHEYQLWSQPKADAPMQSVGVLGRTPSGHRLRIPSPSVRLAISVEPDGGSTQPTTDPVAISDLRAA